MLLVALNASLYCCIDSIGYFQCSVCGYNKLPPPTRHVFYLRGTKHSHCQLLPY